MDTGSCHPGLQVVRLFPRLLSCHDRVRLVLAYDEPSSQIVGPGISCWITRSFCGWFVLIFEMFIQLKREMGMCLMTLVCHASVPFLLCSLVLVPHFAPLFFALSLLCFCLDLRSQNCRPFYFFKFRFISHWRLWMVTFPSYHESRMGRRKKAKFAYGICLGAWLVKGFFLNIFQIKFVALRLFSCFTLFPLSFVLAIQCSQSPFPPPFLHYIWGCRTIFWYACFLSLSLISTGYLLWDFPSPFVKFPLQRINSRQVYLTWSNDYSTLYLAYYYGWRRVYIRPLGRL